MEARSAAHDGELVFQRDLPSASSIHPEVGCVRQRCRVRVTHRINYVLLCAYRLCINRHASVPGFTMFMLSSASPLSMADTVEIVSEG